MEKNEQWLKWAVELQALAQNGLFYGKDKFDLERYERIREIAAEMISFKTDIPIQKVKNLFCNDIGYQTPKIDTRAAIFEDGKILLVHEANGAPGLCRVDGVTLTSPWRKTPKRRSRRRLGWTFP